MRPCRQASWCVVEEDSLLVTAARHCSSLSCMLAFIESEAGTASLPLPFTSTNAGRAARVAAILECLLDAMSHLRSAQIVMFASVLCHELVARKQSTSSEPRLCCIFTTERFRKSVQAVSCHLHTGLQRHCAMETVSSNAVQPIAFDNAQQVNEQLARLEQRIEEHVQAASQGKDKAFIQQLRAILREVWNISPHCRFSD